SPSAVTGGLAVPAVIQKRIASGDKSTRQKPLDGAPPHRNTHGTLFRGRFASITTFQRGISSLGGCSCCRLGASSERTVGSCNFRCPSVAAWAQRSPSTSISKWPRFHPGRRTEEPGV